MHAATDDPTTATYNAQMQDLIQRLLIELGEDPAREGLVKTPRRVDKALTVSHERLLRRTSTKC